jgi:hypothetical protein
MITDPQLDAPESKNVDGPEEPESPLTVHPDSPHSSPPDSLASVSQYREGARHRGLVFYADHPETLA